MIIFVKAKPAAKEVKIKKIDNTHFNISVKEPPIRGRANEAIIKVLAEYFKIKKDNIKLIKGFNLKNKIFEIKMSISNR